MKKKKILTLVLAFVMLMPTMFVLSACGDISAKFKVSNEGWTKTFTASTYKDKNFIIDLCYTSQDTSSSEGVVNTLQLYQLKVKDGAYQLLTMKQDFFEILGYDGSNYYYSDSDGEFSPDIIVNEPNTDYELRTILADNVDNEDKLKNRKLDYVFSCLRDQFEKFSFDVNRYFAIDSEKGNVLSSMFGYDANGATDIQVIAYFCSEDGVANVSCEYKIGNILYKWDLIINYTNAIDFSWTRAE